MCADRKGILMTSDKAMRSNTGHVISMIASHVIVSHVISELKLLIINSQKDPNLSQVFVLIVV